jgi:hypothetical protein
MVRNLSTRLAVLAALALASAVFLATALRAEDKDEGTALIKKDASGWAFRDKEAGPKTWKIVSKVGLADNSSHLKGEGDGGDALILLRQQVGHGSDIYTEETFGDCQVHVEFMVPKGSNSGIYLMGQYEVQVFDSFGKTKITQADVGAIYSARAPEKNFAKAPGEWQTFDITFRAPRFDADGKKTENARFVSVVFNGEQIHKDVEVKGPTGGQLPGGEKAKGPLLIQGDHGEVALRNVKVKALELK